MYYHFHPRPWAFHDSYASIRSDKNCEFIHIEFSIMFKELHFLIHMHNGYKIFTRLEKCRRFLMSYDSFEHIQRLTLFSFQEKRLISSKVPSVVCSWIITGHCNGCTLSKVGLNSLWPSDTIWRHESGSALAQVMACCLTAPSHYLN